MTVQNPPYALQAGSHSAELFRRAISSSLPAGGVINAGDLAVAANGTPNMTVNVAGGHAWVVGTELATQGSYYLFNDATLSVAIAAADLTNPRRDLIVARIQDAQYSGAANTATIEVVQGTPAAIPVDPAVPANCLLLARVAVAASAGSITNANITDLRVILGRAARLSQANTWGVVQTFTNGVLSSEGRFGPNALGSPGQQVHLTTDGTDALVSAEGSTANIAMIVRSRGISPVRHVDDGNNLLFEAYPRSVISNADTAVKVFWKTETGTARYDTIGVGVVGSGGAGRRLLTVPN